MNMQQAAARRELNRILGGGEIVRRQQIIKLGRRAVSVTTLPPVDISAFGVKPRTPTSTR